MVENFFFFVLAILKTNPFSHHLYKRNLIQNLDFYQYSAFLYTAISRKGARNNPER